MTEPAFSPTHTAPTDGMDTWAEPDPSRSPDNRLDPEVPVQVLEDTTGWARVRCSNGWEAWVDASKLEVIETGAFAPTHSVPAGGLETRERPELDRPPDNRLDPGLPVEVTSSWGDWAKVRCENGWETWVDARGLQSFTPPTAAAAGGFSPLVIWLPIVGAAMALLGGVLPWFSGGGVSISAWDIPVVSLFTHEDSDFDLKTGVVLLLVVLALLPLLTGRPLPFLAAGAVAGVGTNIGLLGFFLYFDLPEPRTDIGIGLILVLVGGLTMAAGPLLSFVQARRQLAR